MAPLWTILINYDKIVNMIWRTQKQIDFNVLKNLYKFLDFRSDTQKLKRFVHESTFYKRIKYVNL